MLGIDALGLAHRKFDIKVILKAVPKDWAIGAFDHPFGNVAPKIKKLIKAGYKTFRIQLWWGPGSSHTLAPLEHTKKQAKKWEKIAKANPHCKFYLSHSCEYKTNSQAEVQKRVRILKDLAPSTSPVNSVWQGPTTPGVITEHHGDVTVRIGEIVSTDGDNHYDIDAEAWRVNNEGALIRFVWGYRCNLREIPDPGQKVPAPGERTAAPSVEYIESLVRLLYPKYASGNSVRKPELYKTHSEDDQEENPNTPDERRELRPVLISNHRAAFAEIIASNGTVIGKMPRYPDEGSNRYYSGLPGGIGLYGYQIGEKALKVSGSEIVTLKVGNHTYPNINPAFREGTSGEQVRGPFP